MLMKIKTLKIYAVVILTTAVILSELVTNWRVLRMPALQDVFDGDGIFLWKEKKRRIYSFIWSQPDILYDWLFQ